jgi:hypothetical protein
MAKKHGLLKASMHMTFPDLAISKTGKYFVDIFEGRRKHIETLPEFSTQKRAKTHALRKYPGIEIKKVGF